MRVMLRYGELTLKSRPVRNAFTARLASNIRDALSRQANGMFHVEREWSRTYIELEDPQGLDILTRIFGISSLSVVETVALDSKDQLADIAAERFAPFVAGRRFAVRVRRTGVHPFRSQDLAGAIGGRLVHLGKVDLTHPEIEVHVEVRNEQASLFTESSAAPGGMPLGAEHPVLALVSGGFDSMVATWRMMKRGCPVHFLFCTLGGKAHELSALRVIKHLCDRWSYGYEPKLHIVDFAPILEELQREVRPEMWSVILKRQFLRAGERICRRRHLPAMITGDAVGQVSSQTIINLSMIQSATSCLVLRPLLGMDKNEILAEARRIGTFDLSSRVREYCGLTARHARTRARQEEVTAAEAHLDFTLVDRQVDAARVLDVLDMTLELEDQISSLEVDVPPSGAEILDIRLPAEIEAWEIHGARIIGPGEVLAYLGGQPAWREFVLVCENGNVSADVAVELREQGLNALSIRGGAAGWRRRLRAEPQ